MNFYNTLNRKKEEFQSLEKGKASKLIANAEKESKSILKQAKA